MMRPVYILLTVMAVSFARASFADDNQDCKAACSSEKETRNMNCPSAYDVSDSDQVRRQCLKNSQTAYEDCVKHCAAPPPSGERASPPASGY